MNHRHDERTGAGLLRPTGGILAVFLAGVLAAGCGDLTAGGVAETDVVVSGDAEEPEGASPGAVASTAEAEDSPTEEGSGARTIAATDGARQEAFGAPLAAPPVGEVTVTFELSLEAPDGSWVSLTEGPEQVTVDLSGTSEPTVASRSLDPGLYARYRLRVTEVTAEVTGGLPHIGLVEVDFGDEEALVVERSLELELEADDEVEVLIDLNSAQWLQAAPPALPVVAAVHLRQALELRVR